MQQPAKDILDVLVVDDSHESAEVLAASLAMDGYRVKTCHSGASALQSIAQDYPLCVLLDFGLPDMDGLDIVETVRANYGDAIVLIMVTGWDVGQPRVARAADLVDHYFVKPVSLDKVRQILPPLGADGGTA